jgi:hypothetical protein
MWALSGMRFPRGSAAKSGMSPPAATKGVQKFTVDLLST